MQELPLTLDDIQNHLRGIEDFKPALIKRYFDEEAGPEGRLFFLIQYEPGEFIMARGEFSDYAAVHLQGLVRVCELERPKLRLPECWSNPRPWRRKLATLPLVGGFLAKLFPVRYGEGRLTAPSDTAQNDPDLSRVELEKLPLVVSTCDPQTGAEKPIADRFLGVTSVLWKIPRTRTLVADNEGSRPCRMLLVKRRALLDLLFQKKGATLVPTKLYQSKMPALLRQTLPDLLSKNRLFRSILYVEDVRQWDAVAYLFQGPEVGSGPLSSLRLLAREQLQGELAPSGETGLDDASKYLLVSALNRVLTGPDLLQTYRWARAVLDDATLAHLEAETPPFTPNRAAHRNRLILEAVLPDILARIRDFPLVHADDFRGPFIDLISRQPTALLPQRTEKGEFIFQAGQDADAMYFILQGKYRVTRPGPGGTLISNHLEEDGFFGEACALDDAQEQPPKRSAAVEALSRGVLLRLERSLVRQLCEQFPTFRERLLREGRRAVHRDAARTAGRRVPPQEPPLDIAMRLQVTTNLLVIDMDRCTRCDQCVQACATAHEDRPRFHRANPDLRFGKWEVAGACLHCSDAPCLEECPVGAITFLEGGAVQIHRNRCIGCTKCASACPFGVIDMYQPADNNALDKTSLPANKFAIATKCDLCLTETRNPPCVAACPYGAAQRGKPEEFFPGLRGWARLTDPE